MIIHRDYVDEWALQQNQVEHPVNGDLGLEGSFFLGVTGISVSAKLTADVNGNNCEAFTVCGQAGLGVYVGGGVSGSIGLGDVTTDSTTYGVFGNYGTGASVGGSINFNSNGGNFGKGILGSGTGVNGGFQICKTFSGCN
jgi:hypothetical protein